MFALAFSYPLLSNMTGMGLDHDWDQTMEMHWAPVHTVVHFHQFPLWDPYKCGGIALLANPSSRILTPFFLLHLIFGPLVGIHLEIIAHIALGFGGAYFLARLLEIGKLGALTCGAAFVGSSWYYLHMAPGHGMFMSVTYVPWVVALFWMGWQRRELMFAVGAGLVTALVFFEGGIYQTSYLGLTLTALAIVLALQHRSWFPILLLAVTGFFVVAFAAPKFLPTLHMVGLSPRTVDPFEKNTFPMFIAELFSRDQFFSRDSMGGFWGWWELGAYIGVIFASLAVLGAVLRFRRSLPWLVTGLMFLMLAAGNHGEFSPWVWVHKLPIFSGEHAPTRMLMVFTLCVGVLAGLAVDAVCSLRRWWLTVPIALILMVAMVDCWRVSVFNLKYGLDGGNRNTFPYSPAFQQYYLPDSNQMFMMAVSNLGVANCYEPSAQGMNAIGSNQQGYRGEQYLIGNGHVSLLQWTPNLLDYEVEARGPATVVINQNYDSEWKLVKGRGTLIKDNGLLTVRVPPGKQLIELRYYSTSFLHGCEIFLIGIVVAVFLQFAERRCGPRRSRTPGSSRNEVSVARSELEKCDAKSTEAPQSHVQDT